MRANTIAAIIVLFFVWAARVEAQGSLDAARNLYASAEYDTALTMLDGLLSSAERPREEQQWIELYRVLCLVATGREADATGAIEGFITRHPLYRPTTDLPPRVRSTLEEARKRLLPAAVQATYQGAKAAYDFKDYASAVRGFGEVLEILADPGLAVLASQSPLADLRTLATGFHELSTRALVPPAPVAAPPPPSAAVAPSPTRNLTKIYGTEDPNVVPPIVVNQRIPSFPGPIRETHTGVIQVVIDNNGAVESASMVASINPKFDRIALSAAKDWQYHPARVNGVPVKFAKRVQVNIVPNP